MTTLKTLHELAWEVPDNLIKDEYINADGEKCAVGWMLHEAGVPDEEILELASIQSRTLVIRLVGTLYGLSEGTVNHIISTNDSADDETPSEGPIERQLAIRRKLLELTGAHI